MSNRSLYRAVLHVRDLIPETADGLLLQIQSVINNAIAEELRDRKFCITADCKEGGTFFIPVRWMNLEQVRWFNNKHPEMEFATFAGAKFASMDGLVGYPGKTYHFPDELITDDFKIRHILQPPGAIGLGKRWYYGQITDPNQWFTTIARPHYASLYKETKSMTAKNAIQSLVEMVKEDIENGTFPFKEPQ